jgi:pyruvate kinase
MMDRIARKVEGAIVEEHFQWDFDTPSTNDAITRSSFNIARGINAAAIVTPTWSGSTPRLVSRFRPRQPIIATTPNKKTAGFLALCWGVMPVSISSAETIDDQLRLSVEAARNSGLVKDGDQIVITGGTPLHISGTTNFIKVEQVE